MPDTKKADKKRWVAYTDLGSGSGSFVDPEDHGGEESDNWKYMVDHRVVVPLGDPDAAIVMGSEAAVAAADEEKAAQEAEVQALKDRIKELEDEAAAAKKAESSSPKSGPSGPGSGSSTSSSGTKSGG